DFIGSAIGSAIDDVVEASVPVAEAPPALQDFIGTIEDVVEESVPVTEAPPALQDFIGSAIDDVVEESVAEATPVDLIGAVDDVAVAGAEPAPPAFVFPATVPDDEGPMPEWPNLGGPQIIIPPEGPNHLQGNFDDDPLAFSDDVSDVSDDADENLEEAAPAPAPPAPAAPAPEEVLEEDPEPEAAPASPLVIHPIPVVEIIDTPSPNSTKAVSREEFLKLFDRFWAFTKEMDRRTVVGNGMMDKVDNNVASLFQNFTAQQQSTARLFQDHQRAEAEIARLTAENRQLRKGLEELAATVKVLQKSVDASTRSVAPASTAIRPIACNAPPLKFDQGKGWPAPSAPSASSASSKPNGFTFGEAFAPKTTPADGPKPFTFSFTNTTSAEPKIPPAAEASTSCSANIPSQEQPPQ
ncbi:hypothetical protein HDU96_004656, partial [Phlyctochytrium bullatum]